MAHCNNCTDKLCTIFIQQCDTYLKQPFKHLPNIPHPYPKYSIIIGKILIDKNTTTTITNQLHDHTKTSLGRRPIEVWAIRYIDKLYPLPPTSPTHVP